MKNKMKKTISILLILSMVFCFAACKKEEQVGLANPMASYDSLAAINEKVGCKLSSPAVMGVTDKSYTVTGDTLAEYVFELNGVECTYRAAKESEDISGIYGKDGLIFGAKKGNLLESYEGEDFFAFRFFDNEMQYTLVVGTTDKEKAYSLVKELGSMAVENASKYNSLEGFYTDEFSQRATAEVESLLNGVKITVHWGSSYAESSVWVLNAKYDYSNNLYYEDCLGFDYILNEKTNEMDEVERLVPRQGYFEVKEGKLLWSGSAEEDCKECVFVYDSPLGIF